MTNDLKVGEHDLTKSDGEKYVRVCSKSEHPNYDSRKTIHPIINQMMKRNYVHFCRHCCPCSFYSMPHFLGGREKEGKGE